MGSGIACTPHEVREHLDAFTTHADADELIVAHQSPTLDDRVCSALLLAEVSGLAGP